MATPPSSPRNPASTGPHSIPMFLRSGLGANQLIEWDGSDWVLIAKSSVGVTDHGALTGLGDDDHTQYLLAAGTRALTANWDAGAFEIAADSFSERTANPEFILNSDGLGLATGKAIRFSATADASAVPSAYMDLHSADTVGFYTADGTPGDIDYRNATVEGSSGDITVTTATIASARTQKYPDGSGRFMLEPDSNATSGDLPYYSSGNVWSRLAKGTDGHVLTLASGLPSWAAASAGPGTLFDSANNESGTTWDSAGTMAGGKLYRLQFTCRPASDGADLWFRVYAGGAWQTGTSYQWTLVRDADDHGTDREDSGNASSAQYIKMNHTNSGWSSGGGDAGIGTIWFGQRAGSGQFLMTYQLVQKSDNTATEEIEMVWGAGVWNSTTTVTAVRLMFSTGNVNNMSCVMTEYL